MSKPEEGARCPAACKPYSGSSSTALACGESARTTMDLNCSSCSRDTARFSIFNSMENRLRNASRWSMASAAMMPRESETASSPFRLPDDSLTRILPFKRLFHHRLHQGAENLWADPLCFIKKGRTWSPPSHLNCLPFCELERNPQPQPNRAAAVYALLRESLAWIREIRVRNNRIDS